MFRVLLIVRTFTRPISGRFFAALSLCLVTATTHAAPAILFTDVESGPATGGPNNLGVPISIFGKGFGAARGSSTVTIGGVEVAAYNTWGTNNATNAALDMIVVQPAANSISGSIVVTVNGQASNANFSFRVNSGKVRYVATNGVDTTGPNACTEASPCKRVLHAVSAAITGPGDTILVRGGTYDESEIWIRNVNGDAGAPGQQKTIKNYPNETPVFDNAARPVAIEANYITISGLQFLNGKSIGVPDLGDANRLRGNKFVNLRADGAVGWSFIDLHGDDHVLAGNVCEATTSVVGTQGHCYYVSYGNNLRLIYNVGSGAPGYALHIFDQRRRANDFRRVISNVLVEGNLLKNSKRRSGLILAMGDEDGIGNRIENVLIRNNTFTANNHTGIVLGANTANVRIYNNTFYQNGRQDVLLSDVAPLKNVIVRNNLFYHSPNANCVNDCSWYQDAHLSFTPAAVTGLTIENNGYFPRGGPIILSGIGSNYTNLGASGDPANVTGGVSFVNEASYDFRLQSGSDAIDRGMLLLNSVPKDYNGVVRAQGAAIDLGAFEFDANETPSIGCRTDLDGDGTTRSAVDALMLSRMARGMFDSSVAASIAFPANATRTTWALADAYAREGAQDIDGDGWFTVTDAIILLRAALGFSGEAVTNDLHFAHGAARTSWPVLRAYLVSQCGMSLPN